MSHHDAGHQHFKDRLDHKTVLQYLNRLYCIELLRYADVRHVDLHITMQYGRQFNQPWIDDSELARKYMHAHHWELMQYIKVRLHSVVEKLYAGMKDLTTNLYTQIPLDPAGRLAIVQALKELDDNDFGQRLKDYATWNMIKYLRGGQMMRPVTGMWMPFELADRLLCGIFDTYTMKDESFSNGDIKACRGPNRQEILDDPVYLCMCKINALGNTFYQGALMDEISWQWGIVASMLSIAYRLYIPRCIHPNRMDRFYDKYILHHPDIVPALQFARKWRWLSVEAVAMDHLPEMPHTNMVNLKESTVLEEGFRLSTVYPNDLVEKYLVSQWLLEHCACH